MRNEVLWRNIQAHPFDDPREATPFSMKLAIEQGWETEFTARVIEEYRRFLYLACVSKMSVTPSISVDKVWHHHLTYTRNYWDELCDNVLGRKLHHDRADGEPTDARARNSEAAKFLRQYNTTLDLYLSEFGTPAPTDIWRRGVAQNVPPPLPPAQRVAPQNYRKRGDYLIKLGGFLCMMGVVFWLDDAERREVWGAALGIGGAALVLGLLMYRLGRGKAPEREVKSEPSAGCATGCGARGTWDETAATRPVKSNETGGIFSSDDGGGASCGGGGCGGD